MPKSDEPPVKNNMNVITILVDFKFIKPEKLVNIAHRKTKMPAAIIISNEIFKN
jgi:hypothetical protein